MYLDVTQRAELGIDGKTEHCTTHGLVGKKWDCTPQEKAALKEKTK